jgi:hypothetical protein
MAQTRTVIAKIAKQPKRRETRPLPLQLPHGGGRCPGYRDDRIMPFKQTPQRA